MDHRGFSLTEMMVSTGLVVLLVASIFLMMSASQNSFFVADASIDLRNQLREANKKIGSELRQTGYNASSTAQFVIANGTGTNNTDILTFSIPILCTSSMSSILDSNGDPAYWGAPLTWGCSTSSCMDANNSCSTLEYKYIRYQLDSTTNLIRQVLSESYQVVAQSTVASNITDFQVDNTANLNGRLITVVMTGQKQSVNKRTITLVLTEKIMVSNHGT